MCLQRDEAAIQRWRERDWPRIKKGTPPASYQLFLDDTGFVLQPVNRHFGDGLGAPLTVRL